VVQGTVRQAKAEYSPTYTTAKEKQRNEDITVYLAGKNKKVPFMMSYEWHFSLYLHLKVYRELCRIRDEQKTFGKIYVNTEL